MALTIMPTPRQMFLLNSVAAVANGFLYTYVAGSVSTDLETYSDEDGLVVNANPILLDSAGRPWNGSAEVNVYLLPRSYKFVLKTSALVTVWESDHVPATPTLTSALDITGVAGENLVADDVVYLSASDGFWYKADADAAASSSTAGMVGVVPAAIASGDTGIIRLQGRVTGYSSLSIGSPYYISATAGGITVTAPSNARFVGVADTATTLVISPNPVALAVNDTNLLLTGQVFS